MFAPVYFNGDLRARAGFSYSPSTVVNSGMIVSHLFLRPRYGHYYFGDYYGSNYAQAGFSPSFSFQASRLGYDPIYANQSWQNRNNPGWEQRTDANYQNLRDNEKARPPRNWAAQAALVEQATASNGTTSVAVAAPLDEVIRRNDGNLRFQQVSPAEQQQFGQRGQDYRKYLQQRQQLEAAATIAPGAAPVAQTAPTRRTFSISPFVGPSADQLGQDLAPPQRHEVLKPPLQAQPQPIFRGSAAGTRLDFRPGAVSVGAPVRQIQVQPQAQPQRQDGQRGNPQTAPPQHLPAPSAAQEHAASPRQSEPRAQSQGESEKGQTGESQHRGGGKSR